MTVIRLTDEEFKAMLERTDQRDHENPILYIDIVEPDGVVRYIR